MLRFPRRFVFAALAFVAVYPLTPAAAQSYPTRPITIIVPLAAGTGMDTVVRLYGDELSKSLGQSVVVDNRPGAATMIGTDAVAKATPDGYTLLVATSSAMAINPVLYKKIAYDPVKDFVPITRVGSFTLMLVVDPKLPIHSVQEMIDYAKANPGKLTFASGNTAGVVAVETIKHAAGISVLHVPYKSTPPALEDIMGGRVSMMLADFTTAMPHVNAGTLRPIAVSRIRRSTLYPDLPTMDEAGIKGFNLDTWAGIVAPAGTPPQTVMKLNQALRKIIDNPETQAKFKNVGFEGFSSTPEELGDFVKAQLAEWGRMIKDANIQLD